MIGCATVITDMEKDAAMTTKYLDVATIDKELADTSARAEEIVDKIKSLNEETTKLKETLLILTGAKLAFKKIIDASEKRDRATDTTAS